MNDTLIVSGFFDFSVPPPVASNQLYDYVVESLLENRIPEDLRMASTSTQYQVSMPINVPDEWLLNRVLEISMDDILTEASNGITADQWQQLVAISSQKCKSQRKNKKSCDCTICMDDVKRRFILPCGHVFHRKCIRKWLDDNHTCPICRQDVTSTLLDM